MLRLCATFPALLLILSGCATPPDEDEVRLAAFYLALADARCYRLTACCSAAETDVLIQDVPELANQDGCVDHYNSELAARFDREWASILAGESSLNAHLMRSCLDATQSCGWTGSCDDVVSGPEPLGSRCTSDLECAQGSCLFGSCEVLFAEGAQCAGLHLCRPDLFCDLGVGGTGTCTPLKDMGDECLGSHECKSDNCDGSGPTFECMGPDLIDPTSVDECRGL